MSTLRKATLGLLTVGLLTLGSQPVPGLAAEPRLAGGPPTAAAGNPVQLTNGFYIDPNSNPATYVKQHPGETEIKTKIADKAGGRWFGNWSGDIKAAVTSYTTAADRADKLPILVAYNIPGRDCGGHSGGGAGSPAAYRDWIAKFADGIGNRPAVVVIEPDALAQLDCMPENQRPVRIDLLKYAVNQIASKNPNTWAYMDGGNTNWIAAGEMARRLRLVDVGKIRGFALNVSNYYTTQQSVTKGNAIKTALGGGSQFVVDTSRNANGSNGEWCNPAGRKLGVPSQVGGGADLLLWLKVPGDSDGDCGIGKGIPAGTFSATLAKRLISGT
jgi:endoglucanase